MSRWLADLQSETELPVTTLPNPAEEQEQAKKFQSAADTIREKTQEEISRIAKERFTTQRGRKILDLSKKEAAFLEEMMDSNRWRKLLIDLSATNKNSALLMYCLQAISKRGHHREIARRINQSDHFAVFSAMLASEVELERAPCKVGVALGAVDALPKVFSAALALSGHAVGVCAVGECSGDASW